MAGRADVGDKQITGFWKPQNNYGEFSQWYMSDFTVGGITYCCAEQYMMAEKARLFNDNATLNSILTTRSPSRMRTLGRQVTNFDAAQWDANKQRIVLQATREKYTQSDQLRRKLLGTGDNYLVELSASDAVWGVRSTSANPDRWRGQNLLGQALMSIRAELRAAG